MANTTEIKQLSEINYAEKPTIKFFATVADFISQGDGDKKPFKILVKLESSGEMVQAFSWNWGILDLAKTATTSSAVFEFVGEASLYKDDPQIRIMVMKDAGMTSTKKKETTVDTGNYKKELLEIIKTYIPKSNIYYQFIEYFIINNEKFWIWPAATAMHHAYPGGLAKHTINVVKNAIAIWKTYNGENLRIDTIVAAAALHDIGKLLEYNADGSRTIYGDLVPHIVAGYQMLFSAARDFGLDMQTNMDLVMLGHIILAHHEKLEWGTPVQPAILEALIVARADCLDANIETIEKNLANTEINQQTQSLRAMSGSKFLKWHF